MIADIILQVLKTSLFTSPLIGLLLLLVPMLQKRYRAKWRCMVWIVISVRLLIPFNPTLPQSPIRIELPVQASPVLPLSINIPTQQEENTAAGEIPEDAAVLNTVPGTTASPLRIIGFVWLAGAMMFLIFQICVYQIFLRRLKSSHTWNVPESIGETIWRIAGDMGISGLPDVVVTDDVDAPVLIGVLKPRILLPHKQYSGEGIAFILRHELVHYRRRDMWYKLVLLSANALHWFNPLFYLMSAQAAKDIELACDDDVIREFDRDARAEYGNTILTALPGKRRSEPMFSTNFGSSKRNMKSRLHNLFDTSVKHRGIAALCVVAFCTLTFASLAAFGYPAAEADSIPVITDELSFSVPDIAEGAVVCIGKIELSPDVSYIATLTDESGNDVMIALNASPDITQINGTTWNNYYGGFDNAVINFRSERTKTAYMYVGNQRNNSTALTNATGRIVAVDTSSSMPVISGNYMFNIPHIDAGKVVCIGKIELEPDVSYVPYLMAGSGSGLIMALSDYPDITEHHTATGWNIHFGAGSNIPITAGQKKTAYLYVGSSSDDGTELTNVTGMLTVSDTAVKD